jgi:hypothetical protein
MAQQCHAWCSCYVKAYGFGFGFTPHPEFCKTFGQHQRHMDMAYPKSATQRTQMKEMKWLSSAMLGVLAANKLGFGLALTEICQTFCKQPFQDHMA